MNVQILFKIALCSLICQTGYGISSKNLAALALSYIGGYGLDYFSTHAHELGHAVTNKLITGDPINTYVRPRGLGFEGGSIFKTNLSHRTNAGILRVIAGPLAGILATQLQLSFIDYLQQLCSKKRAEASLLSSLMFTPISHMKNIYHDVCYGTNRLTEDETANYSPESLVKTTLEHLKTNRCGSMLSQAAYGFLPVDISTEGVQTGVLSDDLRSALHNHSLVGDGQYLWSICSIVMYPNVHDWVLILCI